jgi:drug/metabolite transporter (DMT)-like permease
MTGDRTVQAVVLIVAAVFLLSAADAVVKLVSAQYSVWQIYTARSVFSVAILVALLARSGERWWVDVGRFWIMVRSALLTGMWIAYYFALPSMPLSVAATALYTTPLFIALLSSAIGREPVGLQRWVGILLGFAGVVVVLRPGAEDFSYWTLLPVVGAAFYALAAIVTRTRCAADSALVLALGLHLWLLATGVAGTVAIMAFDPRPVDPFLLGRWTPMAAGDWLLMAGLGAVMVAVAISVARAYQIGAPATVGTFDYMYLVFSVAWGIVVFGESPDGWTFGGILLIVMAGLIVLRRVAPRPVAAAGG